MRFLKVTYKLNNKVYLTKAYAYDERSAGHVVLSSLKYIGIPEEDVEIIKVEEWR